MSGCLIELKDGSKAEVDMTASRIKHMRRSGGVLTLYGHRGVEMRLPARLIRKVTPLAPVETTGVE